MSIKGFRLTSIVHLWVWWSSLRPRLQVKLWSERLLPSTRPSAGEDNWMLMKQEEDQCASCVDGEWIVEGLTEWMSDHLCSHGVIPSSVARSTLPIPLHDSCAPEGFFLSLSSAVFPAMAILSSILTEILLSQLGIWLHFAASLA